MLNFNPMGTKGTKGTFWGHFYFVPRSCWGHSLVVRYIYLPQNVPHDIAPGGTIKSATFPTWHPDGGQNHRRPVKALSKAVFFQEGKVPNEGTGKVKRKDFMK